MSRLPVVSGEQLITALNKVGFVFIRQKGSHIRLEKQTDEGIIRLSVPRHRMIKRGTLRGIIKDAGLTMDKFHKLL